jgi:uncharacterized membrane protein YgcG
MRLALIIVLLLGASAHAGFTPQWQARKNGMNAVHFQGRTLTFTDLVRIHDQNPGKLVFGNARLTKAVSHGLEGLTALRARAPHRFDFYHPILGYLLVDTTPLQSPVVTPTVVPPDTLNPTPTPEDGGSGGTDGGGGTGGGDGGTGGSGGQTPTAVPEPAAFWLAVSGVASLGLFEWRRRKNAGAPTA